MRWSLQPLRGDGAAETAAVPDGVFRRYSDDDIARFLRIKELRDDLGLRLAEVKEVIAGEALFAELTSGPALRQAPAAHGDHLARLLEMMQTQLRDVEARLEVLESTRIELRHQISTVRRWRSRGAKAKVNDG